MPKDAASPNAGKGITKAFSFWQDREIRFDSPFSVLELRENTEQVYATFRDVEDTKGNNGHAGVLLVTNLRLIWWSSQRRSLNLSIGYYCIQRLLVQESESKLAGGTTESLTISSKFGGSRFQFLFSAVHVDGPVDAALVAQRDVARQQRLHATVHAVWSAYESTRVYRELRLRGAVVQNGNVVLLRGESVISRTPGVTNVSKEEGIFGTFVVTNIRVLWFATEEAFNVSVPLLQLIGLRSQQSKFGPTLVLETSSYAGNFVLGFRLGTEAKLNELYAEISAMWRAWSAKPLLGIQVNLQDMGNKSADAVVKDADVSRMTNIGGGVSGACKPSVSERQMEGACVVQEAPRDAFAAYYADEAQKGADRRPVYEPSIGLAVEKLRKGATMQSLWDASVPE